MTDSGSEIQDEKAEKLVREAQIGNKQAFATLYDMYFDRIYRFIFFRVSHREIAEDLAEDVFVKAWTKISSVKGESFGGWLYSIAKNRVIDHYRQEKQTVNLFEVENLIESEQNLSEEANLAIDRDTLIKLIKQLTPEQQIVITLKFIEDLENSEIAELISKTEGSIRVIQHRAIQRLQQLMGAHIESTRRKMPIAPMNHKRNFNATED